MRRIGLVVVLTVGLALPPLVQVRVTGSILLPGGPVRRGLVREPSRRPPLDRKPKARLHSPR